MINLLI